MVSEENAKKYLTERQERQMVTFVAQDEEGTKKTLFHGLIADLSVRTQNGVNILKVEGISNTILMDILRHTRTFQSPTITYDQVAGVIESEGEGHFLISDGFGKPIESMFVQYDETDWAFAKRMASRLNTVLFPNCVLPSPQAAIGIPQSSASHTITPIEYSIRKNIGDYMINDSHGVVYSEQAETDYLVVSREIYELADQVSFMGLALIVIGVKTNLVGSILQNEYTLKLKSGIKVKEQYNFDLIGANLDATITEIEKDQVKVHVNVDRHSLEDRWFPYATPYSSPDGTGWYFMPEIGDSVRLLLPDEHEDNAYVANSVHKEQNASRNNPDVKSIITKYGKAIIMEPKAIHITNGTGSSISLRDGEGIFIETGEKVMIDAAEDITFNSGEKILIQGDEGVVLDQCGNTISVDDNIDLTAGYVRMR